MSEPIENLEQYKVIQNNFNLLFDSGRFKFPLYHATSSAFIPSILEHGLGGLDIVEEYRVLELLEKLAMLIEAHLPDYGEEYIEQLKLISRQETGNNWRHGGAFLTPSIDRAVKYAVNEFGSELLSILSGIHADVVKYIPGTSTIIDDYPGIKRLLSANHRPVLIVVDDVEGKSLQAEDGNDIIRNMIKLIFSFGDNSHDSASISEHMDDVGQQINFQLTEPKHIDISSCFEIVYQRRDKISPRYELIDFE
ncbi:hypothetical protein [Geobacter sulfurreducens]|uniref:hypothetical protein n=1 Tax=Geobacter sulfurreducens TaxID=35554 RepID=UPI000DBB5174|nr:hypothetical protein [Geobacter sulfurreducens]BBA70621.1 hypothetical protein YM18_2102 [Geobacter sulfurreducens]